MSTGLSPLARGKRSTTDLTGMVFGPIPAGAGETTLIRSNGITHRAYPRWRGGNIIAEVAGHEQPGLSPLARGKRSRRSGCSHCLGPIPAGAGETLWRGSKLVVSGAYPRWRGGNGLPATTVHLSLGLSPLARGKLADCAQHGCRVGPIPAGAGETKRRCCLPRSKRAYPRWRGGNVAVAIGIAFAPGLSPLARGKRRTAPMC